MFLWLQALCFMKSTNKGNNMLRSKKRCKSPSQPMTSRLVKYTIYTLVAFMISQSACRTSQPSQAAPSVSANSILWKIEGQDIETSYLFGTIHMIDKDEYFFTPEMQAAFDASKALALEFDIESAMDLTSQMGLLQRAFMRNDTTLSDLLSKADYDQVKRHFDEMGIPIFLFERVKPMFLTIFASEDMLGGGGMEDIKSYELELSAMAKSREMPIEGLETMEYQLSIFDSIPYRAQAEMLVASIQPDVEASQSIDTMVYYYKQQNLKKLDALINEDATTKKYRRVLLDNRNKNWIPVIEKLMQQRPVFVAVGAGHLSGSLGVIQLLQDQGYSVSPVISKGDGTH